ncbi:MAG: hypothetical protein WCC63_02985 [Candidatus Bathyarchaeia archaeon]
MLKGTAKKLDLIIRRLNTLENLIVEKPELKDLRLRYGRRKWAWAYTMSR